MLTNYQENLYKIQSKFKTTKGTKAFNYSYSNLSSILPALNKICEDLGLEYTLKLLSSEIKTITPFLQKTRQMTQVSMHIKWSFWMTGMDEPEIITNDSIGSQDDGDKAVGSALTYSRRYVLLNIFNADDGGADDPEQKGNKTSYKAPHKPSYQPKTAQAIAPTNPNYKQPSQQEMAEIMANAGK